MDTNNIDISTLIENILITIEGRLGEFLNRVEADAVKVLLTHRKHPLQNKGNLTASIYTDLSRKNNKITAAIGVLSEIASAIKYLSNQFVKEMPKLIVFGENVEREKVPLIFTKLIEQKADTTVYLIDPTRGIDGYYEKKIIADSFGALPALVEKALCIN